MSKEDDDIEARQDREGLAILTDSELANIIRSPGIEYESEEWQAAFNELASRESR